MPPRLLTPFHYAFLVDDLAQARRFYTETLGCEEGRSSETWIDFNLFGHQIVAHLAPYDAQKSSSHNLVDGQSVPVPHFGVVLDWDIFQAFAEDLSTKNIQFVTRPHIRFAGQVGEQATMFFLDPASNALEFKAFRHIDQLFEGSN